MTIIGHASTSVGVKASSSARPTVPQASRPCWHLSIMVLVAMPLLLTSPKSLATNGDMGWPEATAQLASLRTKAETCVALLKRYGNPGQRAQGQLGYARAKGDIDAVITGLMTALATGGQPASLPSLRDRLAQGSSDLLQFCGSATAILPSSVGRKGVIEDITKAALEPLIKAVSDGVVALYNNHRADATLTRKTIQTQLEAARWIAFDQVSAAQ